MPSACFRCVVAKHCHLACYARKTPQRHIPILCIVLKNLFTSPLSRPRQMVDIQYDNVIMGGREVSRPYRVWFFAEGVRFLSTEPFNPLKSYLHRFFDFLGGDRAFGEHSDSLTANSLTPNHYFYGLLRIFLENWVTHFKFVGAYCIYCVPLSHLCLFGWACVAFGLRGGLWCA